MRKGSPNRLGQRNNSLELIAGSDFMVPTRVEEHSFMVVSNARRDVDRETATHTSLSSLQSSLNTANYITTVLLILIQLPESNAMRCV